MPVEVREVDVPCEATRAGKVGVGDDIEAESILQNRIQAAIGFEDRPVRAELLRADHKNSFIAKLEVFDDCKGFKSFAKPNAVGEDATVIFEQFVDGSLRPIALERVEHFPHFRFQKRGALECVVHVLGAFEFIAEQMEQREEVDELRRVRGSQAPEVGKDLLFHVLGECFMSPDFIEPVLEILAITVGVNDEVQFDVAVRPEAKTGDCEVRASQDGIGSIPVFDMVGFAVEEIGLADRADLHHAVDPLGAGLGRRALGEGFGDIDAVLGEFEIRLRLVAAIHFCDERRFPEEELQLSGRFEL